jgi:hypothetical protein
VALTGWNWLGPGWLPSIHDSAARALLPAVVLVEALACGLKSHGERDARLPTTMPQSDGVVLCFQHISVRVSVLGLFHGSTASGFRGGLAGLASQRAV